MKNRLENKLSMYQAVKKACSDNSAIWMSLVAFATAFADFEAMITAIKTVLRRQLKKSNGITLDKKSMKAAMVKKALVIAKAGFAYASVIEDETLKQEFKFTKSKLVKGSNNRTLELCENIHASAFAIQGMLGPYGVLPPEIAELVDLCDDFSLAIPTPRNAIADHKGATSQLDSLFETSDKILKTRLDMLVERFKASDSEFYDLYINSRIIVDLGTRHEKDGDGAAA